MIFPIATIKELQSFKAVIALGCSYISSPLQERRGALSFLTPKGITTVHANGTVRRTMLYSFNNLCLNQSPIVQDMATETLADWSLMLDRVIQQVSYCSVVSSNLHSLEVMSILFDYARRGSNIKKKYEKRQNRIISIFGEDGDDAKHNVESNYKRNRSEMNELIEQRNADPRLAQYFVRLLEHGGRLNKRFNDNLERRLARQS